jgi:hypothetical protein
VTEKLEAILADANTLAGGFYQEMGHTVPEGYRFDKATHPTEQMCWRMAAMAFQFLTDSDPEDVLAELGEEE